MIIVEQEIKDYDEINIVTTHPNWDIATSYDFGEVIFYGHYYYRSIVDANVGLIPPDNENEWLKWSISNRYAQIDLRATTTTIWDATTATVPADGALITTFLNDNYDVLSFGGVEGDTIKIEVFDSLGALVTTLNNVVYNRPQSNNWYGYYFDLFQGGVSQNFKFDIPPLKGSKITVTITKNSDGYAKVGYMIGGYGISVGCSLYGATLGLDDNSIIEIDDFGITNVTKRIASSYMDIDVVFPPNQIMLMERNARSFFGKIVLFIGDENSDQYEHLATLGYIEGYNVVLQEQELITASYSIKEII